jgi:multicomponent Na+:H+ antiporter subunit D
MPADFPPSLILLIGALLVPLLRGVALRVVALALPAVALLHSWVVIGSGGGLALSFMGMDLNPLHVHAATPAFATIFCLIMIGATLFAIGRASRAELSAAFVYGAGALAVAFSGDLISLLVAWEIMMLGSTMIVWCGGQRDSYGAGLRYFGLHALAGAAMLVGVVIVVGARASAGHADPLEFGNLAPLLGDLTALAGIGAALIFGAVLVCAGAPPFSAWVADAYPEASPTGAVFLSAFTTKSAVFALIVAFAGVEALIWIGLWMALYGIVYAMLENDIRRILAYSIVNQVGFMLVGIGVGTPLAIDGATAHAFAHIIYKGLLVMAAGSVILVTGRRLLSEMGGLFRAMPVTALCCIIAALSISAFPLTSGFTTKSMIDDSLAHHANEVALAGYPAPRFVVAWILLEIATAGVFLHAGIKFPWFVFFAKNAGLRPPAPPAHMRVAMIALAAACILLGVVPGPLYSILPFQAAAEQYAGVVYSVSHVVEMLALLAFGGLGFFLLLPMLQRKRTVTLDFDWIWRRFAPRFGREIVMPLGEAARGVIATAKRLLAERASPNGWVGQSAMALGVGWAIAGPVLVVLLMLLLYLAISFIVPLSGSK